MNAIVQGTKPRWRVKSDGSGQPRLVSAPKPFAFEAGKTGRRLRSVPTSTVAINTLIRSYGRNVVARSRYLTANNPQASAAKDAFVSVLVGAGIKPSSLIKDPALKEALQLGWRDWTDESDADGLTDFYGQQAIVAGEMFEAGECFVRMRPRRLEDGLTVPFQLQILPSEILPLDDNRDLGFGRRVEMGIEFDAIGRRVAYHFLRRHPGADFWSFNRQPGLTVRVPADEVLHLYRPIRAGQLRGIPHTLAGIVTAAILDAYEDAELERKRTAALFGIFITNPTPEDDPAAEAAAAAIADGISNGIALEPGATVDLDPGQDVKFAEPADVGGNFEAFEYRYNLRMATGFGVPYAVMTGDLRQTSYGSMRAGDIAHRRRIEGIQHQVMVYQLCRPVWARYVRDAVMTGGVVPVRPSDYQARAKELGRVKWIPPRWEWIDPQKDINAEKIAVDNGFKARSDVIEGMGYDPEETDARIAADRKREDQLGLSFAPAQPGQASVAPAHEERDDEDEPKPAREKEDA